RRLFAIGFALAALAPTTLFAQAIISGQVTGEVGQPLGAVSVFIPTLGVGTLSRADGTYSLSIPTTQFQPGQQVEVQARLIGFRSGATTIALSPGNTTLNFELASDPLRLQG